MKILRLLIMFILIGTIPSFAAPKRMEVKKLTISGSPITARVIATSQTVTSDSVYQSGNSGYSTLAIKVTGSVAVTQQSSYDNITWWTPYTESAGTLTSAGTVSTATTSDRWIIIPFVATPYIRFNYASTGQSTIDTVYLSQDES